MNPRNYDTENFVFTYSNKAGERALTIKRKNADMTAPFHVPPYRTYCEKPAQSFGMAEGLPSCIEITPLFSEDTSADIHIHKVGQFFTPWFKATTDCRQELEYGIKRFYALEAYDALNLGPDQFAYLIKNNQTTYDQIIERIPDLYTKRQQLDQLLRFNFQDKGVSTSRGSTIFDTINKVWIMSETREQHPDKPEYLWRVSQYSPWFTPEVGHNDFVNAVRGEVASNQTCFEYIMAAQKKLYGVSPVDLDKVESDILRLHGVIAQLELILNIPFSKTAIPENDD